MANWALNVERITILNLLEFDLEGPLVPGLQNGDQVVIFEKEDGEVRFIVVGVIESTETRLTDVTRGEAITAYSVRQSSILDPFRQLSHLMYSMELVTRHDSPGVHFSEDYRQLSDADFATIRDGKVFWARSAFGVLINSLPRERIVDFLRAASTTPAEQSDDRRTFRVLWQQLSEWIDAEYTGAHNLVTGVEEVADRMEDIGVNFAQLQVSSDDSGSNASLASMRAELAELHGTLFGTGDRSFDSQPEQVGLLVEMQQRINEDPETESAFEQLFEGTPWPLIKPM